MAPNKTLKTGLTFINYILLFWLLKSSLSEQPLVLLRPSNKPPISPEFINIALIWRGEKWEIKVVGIINKSRREAPNLCLNPEMKSIELKNK